MGRGYGFPATATAGGGDDQRDGVRHFGESLYCSVVLLLSAADKILIFNILEYKIESDNFILEHNMLYFCLNNNKV